MRVRLVDLMWQSLIRYDVISVQFCYHYSRILYEIYQNWLDGFGTKYILRTHVDNVTEVHIHGLMLNKYNSIANALGFHLYQTIDISYRYMAIQGVLCRSRYQGQVQVITPHFAGCNYLSLTMISASETTLMNGTCTRHRTSDDSASCWRYQPILPISFRVSQSTLMS